jgi:methanogenic corrinoid protein MtbC1
VGLSGLLTTAFDSMKATVETLEAAGLRPGVKVMIGGGSVNETVLKYTRADAFGVTAQDAVNFANLWTSEQGVA